MRFPYSYIYSLKTDLKSSGKLRHNRPISNSAKPSQSKLPLKEMQQKTQDFLCNTDTHLLIFAISTSQLILQVSVICSASVMNMISMKISCVS